MFDVARVQPREGIRVSILRETEGAGGRKNSPKLAFLGHCQKTRANWPGRRRYSRTLPLSEAATTP